MSNIVNKQVNASEGDEIDLSSLFNLISENRWLFLIITLMVMAAGIFYASHRVPQYQSDVLLQIESSQSSLGQTSGMGQQFMFRSTGAQDVAMQTALIQSRYILEPVIRSLGLDVSASHEKGSFWSRLISSDKKSIQVQSFKVPKSQINHSFTLVFDTPSHVKLYNAAGKMLLQGRIGELLSNMDATITLQVSSIDAPIGSRFTLMRQSDIPLIKSLSRRLVINEASGGPTSSLGTGIMDISLTGDNPYKIVQILNAIAKTAKIKDAQKKSQEAAQTLTFLYKQLPISKGSLEKAEKKLNQYRATSGKIDIKQQTQFVLGRLSEDDKQLSKLGIKKIEMLQHYTMAHPLLISLNTQIKALERQRRELEIQLKKLPASDQLAVNLIREVSVKKTLYLTLLSKIQELEVVKAGTVSSVHILAFANLPDAPLPSRHILIYILSIILGVMLSLLVIAARKLISPRINDPHWGEKHFNLPNLAIIPYCKEQTENAMNFQNKTLQKMPLLAHANPRNLAIESLRSLRTSLQVTLSCARNNIISIMGISPGVGKSFVSANLAYLLAAGGKRVLLIDGDLRRGTLHRYFNVLPSPGLVEILKKSMTVETVLAKTLHNNLDFIPRGTFPSDPSELLMSDYFKELMTTLSQNYDVVVIDTAPTLLVTDAVLIGAISSINYLIMGAGAHQPGDIELVMKRLSGAQVEVQGTIFNFYKNETITRSYGQYGKYGKYGYYNTYYYDDSVKS